MEKRQLPVQSEFLIKLTDVYKCTLCDATLVGDASVLKHFNKKQHKTRILKQTEEKVVSNVEPTLPSTESELPQADDLNISIKENELREIYGKFERTSLKISADKNYTQHPEDNEEIHKGEIVNSSVSTSESKLDTSIDGEEIKTLIPLSWKSNRVFKNNPTKVLSKRLFPNLHNATSYIKKFLQSGPDSVFYTDTKKLEKLKFDLELCYASKKEVYCIACDKTISNDPLIYYEHSRNKRHEDKVTSLIEEDKSFQHCKSQLSELARARNFIGNVTNDIVWCVICEIEMENDEKRLLEHIRSNFHIAKSFVAKQNSQQLYKDVKDMLKENWYSVERYWCELCNLKFSIEVDFSNHLETRKHRINAAGQGAVYDVCYSCASLWLGFLETYQNHCQDLMHHYMVQNKVYEMPGMSRNFLSFMHNFEESLYCVVKSADEAITHFRNNRKDVLQSMNELLRPYYPNMKVYVCGSCITGLIFFDNTMDIFLDLGESYMNIRSESNPQFAIVKKCFLEAEDVWELEEITFRNQVPVINIYHESTGLKCSISFGYKLDMKKTEIIKFYTTAYPQCRKMILFLKQWILRSQLFVFKNITTFAITWLVIFYLQRKCYLPHVFLVMQWQKLCNTINSNWKSGTTEHIIRYTHSVNSQHMLVKDLLIGFFDFYANFNYQQQIICPLLGCDVKKEVFITRQDLPHEMFYNYYNKYSINYLNIDSPICLQDPLEYQNNITQNVSKLTLNWFRKYCAQSSKMLMEQH